MTFQELTKLSLTTYCFFKYKWYIIRVRNRKDKNILGEELKNKNIFGEELKDKDILARRSIFIIYWVHVLFINVTGY